MHRLGLERAKLNMLVTGDAGKLAQGFDTELALIKRELEAIGDLSLVIVDTSPALFPGDDENCNVQSRDHAQRLRRITELPGKPCCLALCHPPKHAATADSLIPRGGGAFIAEVDGNLSLWGYGDKLADLHSCGKFRGPDFVKITFRHETVTTPELVDHRGRKLPTVVAQVVEAETTAAGAISEDGQLLAAMLGRPHGTLEEWAADCGWFTKGDAKRPNKSRAKGVSDRLSEAQLVAKKGRKLVLTPDRRGRREKGCRAMSSRNKNATKPDGSSRGAKSGNETRLRSTILLGHSDFLFVLAKRRKPKSTS